MAELETGKVKSFNSRQGSGFIQRDQGGPDIFFRVGALFSGNLKPGDSVKFEITDGPNGKMATTVKII